MTDKIKLKADKFVNDKKLKLNYIKPKDLKLLLAEFCEEQIAELKAECDLAIEGRDVQIQELEDLLDQERETRCCIETDLNTRISELETRCNELFLQTCEQAELIEKMKYCGNCKNYSSTYGLCCYSLGDEDYDCRLRKWEIAE